MHQMIRRSLQDLGKLSAVGKRSNAELINGLLGMNLNKLSSAGRR